MKDEVREALERYRREAYTEGRFGDPGARNVGYLTGEQGWNDRVVLSNAFVADHPPDDADPVTEAWAEANGATRPYGGEYADEWYWRIKTSDRLGTHVVLKFKPNRPIALGICGATVVVNPTRGDVRRLCSALGMKLAEAARTEGR